ncbi:Uncharacterized protein Adt_27779 [Abeliophyllum distichum]|uniref:Uncharacterized protein n=1 Tax=Abeliophyllum distichum TaxID=126358 RepID=A0ABD1RVE3_9LAMI
MHTKFLCMKFSTDRRIATVKVSQSESRACYINAMRKFVDREVYLIDIKMGKALTDSERMDVEPKEEDEHMRELEDPNNLDPRLIEIEPETSPAECCENNVIANVQYR